MRQPDMQNNIDAVLQGLSAIEAPPHLGKDVAHQLSIRLQVSRDAQEQRWALFALWPPALLGSICAALILAIIMFAPPHKGDPNRSDPQPKLAKVEQSMMPIAQEANSQLRSAIGAPARHSINRVFRPEGTLHTRVFQVRLASFPAPVAPLSEQEKLLLEVARRRDPVQLASLNTEIQNSLDTKRRDEFMKMSNGGRQ